MDCGRPGRTPAGGAQARRAHRRSAYHHVAADLLPYADDQLAPGKDPAAGAKYAKAGVRFLWRVEREGRTPVAYTYELDPASGTYVATGVHRGRLKTDIGFPVDIDLAIGA
jgi:hypothetical protein